SGLVQFADDIGEGWGNVMRVMHNIGTKETPILVESLYAHLDKMLLKSGEKVARGQQVGTIGDAHGAYWAHLHFELRDSLQMPIGGGYSNQTAGYLDPTIFIKAHRPAAE
ncbi:MAG TPA: M23 family metallopeptidase, partial [Bacteroidetes bacterium]|nr:M23 family metallopeptidase [Bacteroidota bacterium]